MDLDYKPRCSTSASGRPAHGAGLARGRVLVLLAGIFAVAAVLLPVPSGPGREAAAATSADPAELAFVAREYHLPFQAHIFNASSSDNSIRIANAIKQSRIVGGATWFGQIQATSRSNRENVLEYAVEGVLDESHFNWCDGWPTCYDVAVGAVGETGEMFLWADGAEGTRNASQFVNDFDTQHVEISVHETDTDLKIYREVLVHPWERKPDCSDYPGKNEHAYRCLFLSEHLPPEPPATTESMRNALPDQLTQSKENYSLVLAEEFSGTQAMYPSGPCYNRMPTLNQDYLIWNQTLDPCDNVDANGVPCEDIADGHYYVAYGACGGSGIDTQGHFNFKYGYYETKYTINYDAWSAFRNFAMNLGTIPMPLKKKFAEYGVELDDNESVLIHLGGIVNVFEYIPGSRFETMHSWTNPWGFVKRENTPPIRTSAEIEYCKNAKPHQFEMRPPGFCRTGGTATVTKGVEWTPAGYRFLLKVDGVHDDFIIFDSSKVRVQPKSVSVSSSGAVTFGDGWPSLTGDDVSDFLVHLTPDDADSLLVRVGVSHRPKAPGLGSWGNSDPTERTIRSMLKVDYIRVYQPDDKYTDVEPVYQ